MKRILFVLVAASALCLAAPAFSESYDPSLDMGPDQSDVGGGGGETMQPVRATGKFHLDLLWFQWR